METINSATSVRVPWMRYLGIEVDDALEMAEQTDV
jgi:hypothetical protein